MERTLSISFSKGGFYGSWTQEEGAPAVRVIRQGILLI